MTEAVKLHPLESGRPSIVLTNRQLDEILDEAVLLVGEPSDPLWPPLYMRGGRVIALARDEEDRAVLREVSIDAMTEKLVDACDWFQRVGKFSTLKPAAPTPTVAATLLARLEREPETLRPLRGVTESPVMRTDGSILAEPGYDPSTRLVYVPAPDFELPPVPMKPSGEDLARAVALIDDVFRDFPFAEPADRAVAWGLLATLPLRELVDGPCPLVVVDAPAPGTGKGLLVSCAATIATGRPGGMMPPPGERQGDEEWRKRITATLRAGHALAIVDNVEHPIESPSLAAVLTCTTFEDRRLGKTEMLTLPARTLWCVTGNNVRLRGDLPRRAVWCRLDAKVARPWQRDGFHHPDLLPWVQEQRGELLWAVFTLARAWVQRGRRGPDEQRIPKLGSFESWRDVIGGVLRTAGVEGFLGNLETIYEIADEDTPAWTAFLRLLLQLFATSGSAAETKDFTAAAVARDLTAFRDSELRDAVPPELADALERPSSLSKSLGKAFAGRVDRPFLVDEEGFAEGTTVRIVRAGQTETGRKKALLWRIVMEIPTKPTQEGS